MEKQTGYIHAVEYYSAIKNELLTHIITQMVRERN